MINISPTTATPSIQPTPRDHPWPQPLPPRRPPPPNIPKPNQEKMTWHDVIPITRGRDSNALTPAWRGSTGLCGARDDQPTTLTLEDSQPQVIGKEKQPPPQPQPNTHHSSFIQPKLSKPPPPSQQPPPRHRHWPQPPPPRKPPPPNIPEPQQEKMWAGNGCHDKSSAQQPKYFGLNAGDVDDDPGTRPEYFHLDTQREDGNNSKREEFYNDMDSTISPEHTGSNGPPNLQELTWNDPMDTVFIAILKRTQERPTLGVRVREKPTEGLEIVEDTCHIDAKETAKTMVGEWNRCTVESKQLHKRITKNDMIFSVNEKKGLDNNGLAEMVSELKERHVLHLVIRRPRDIVFIAILKRTQDRQTLGVTVRETPDEGLEIDTDTCYTDAKWIEKTMVGEWNRLMAESKQLYKRIEKNDMIFSVNEKKSVDKQGLAEMVFELKSRHELRLVIRRSINRS